MKGILFLFVFSSSLVFGATYNSACSKGIYTLYILKIGHKAKQRSFAILDNKYKNKESDIKKKYSNVKESDAKDEKLENNSKNKMEEALKVKDHFSHYLCDDSDFMNNLSRLSSERSSKISDGVRLKGRDSESEKIKSPKEFESEISEKLDLSLSGFGYDAVSTIDEKCDLQSSFRNRKKYFKEKNLKTKCKMILNDLNSALKKSKSCSDGKKIKTSKKYTQD